MTTFVLIHGSGDGGWAWHLVQRALLERGHASVAPDLPTDREGATWDDCVDTVAAAAAGTDGADGVVVVGQSAGGFVVPLAAERLGATLQVHVAGMVPRPGETAGEWFEHVGWAPPEAEDPFFHDVPPALAEAARAHERPTSERLGGTPWPGTALPRIPARYVVTARDRFLLPALQRRVAAERLGIGDPDEIDAGHCAHLSRPEALADLLVAAARRADATP